MVNKMKEMCEKLFKIEKEFTHTVKYKCLKTRCNFDTAQTEIHKEHTKEKHREYECESCDFQSSSKQG